MKGVAFYFFFTGVVAVMLGMLWGIQMSAAQDYTMSPVHAHLNLVGWVTFGLFGIYYHLVPSAAQTRLAWAHYGVALAGLVAITVGLTLYLAGGSDAIVVAGSVLTVASMGIFLVTVWRQHRAETPLPAAQEGTPAG